MAWSYSLFLEIFAGLIVLTTGQTNEPPTWVTASYSSLTRGINEATPIGTRLTVLSCTDRDNDTVVYYLKSGQALKVFSNGTVTLAVKLDYEIKDSLVYDLTFVCYDTNKTSGLAIHQGVEARVQISVNDANDNPPEFQVTNAQGYAFSIPEDAKIGTVVESSIQTVDKDKTVNAALSNMYLICNSPNATERQNLPDTSIAMCQKFNLTYMQVGDGKYNATVTVIGVLDYEERPVYSSKLIAIDGPNLTVSLTSSVNLQINIIDMQDRPPVFTNPGDTTTVSENATIGSIVMDFSISTRDGDFGDKRPVALTIVEDPERAFNLTVAVEAVPGEGIYYSKLIINNQLDREQNPGPYLFVVKATEIDKYYKNLTDATATGTYSVFVGDVNDNGPIFSQPVYEVNVTEVDLAVNRNSSLQITGLHILCSDIDSPRNANYSVTIIQQMIGVGANATNVTNAYSISPATPFFIGNASMFLKVDNSMYLDYDIPQYRVQTILIMARETNTKEMFSSFATVILRLQDINDNSPQFDQSAIQIYVREDATPPVNLITINASDVDSGRNGEVTFSLQGGVSGKFSINAITGVLTLIGTLDYEITSEYVFLVVATDGAVEPTSNELQVTVKVSNVNDVAPIFRQSLYQTSVNETSLSFLNPITVTAVDDEVGTTNITYRIFSGQIPTNAFVINSVSGELTLQHVLDFTETPLDANGNNTGVFVIVIEASDNGVPPLYDYTTVNVAVIDENNHPPVLYPIQYNTVLNETAGRGTPVVQIMGTDADSGNNGKISYRLGQGSTDNFAVNESTGWVTVGPAPFDYDVQSQYTLNIIATDGGAPQKSATATVNITLTDTNNKDPFFEKVIYFFNVDDRSSIGTIVEVVVARDVDSTASLQYGIVASSITGTGPNGALLTTTFPYDFREAFGVTQNGSIYIKSKLDHNIMSETTFLLLVRDINTQYGSGISTTQVTIIIRGEVFQNITFDSISRVFMNEDVKVGYSPITVIARDARNQPVSDYEKLSGSNYFAVNKTTGRVTLITPIDYENDTTPDHLHILTIIAYSANKQQSAVTNVTISVADVNDNSPRFQQQNYTYWVSEIAVYPTLVGSVLATDADSSSYGPLDFTLSGLDSDDFSIFLDQEQSGVQTSRRAQVIVAKGKTLDYNLRRQYDLTIIVRDNLQMLTSSIRLYSVALFTINLIDENNNTPNFTEPKRSIFVAETAEVGRSLATIVARDKDQGRNGEIVYTLEPRVTNSAAGVFLFSIGQQSGIVGVSESLIGFGSNLYQLQVRAQDKGDVPRSMTMPLDITVLSTEDNDGNPEILFPPNGYILYAPEETSNYLIRDEFNNSKFFNANARTGKDLIYVISPFSENASCFSINSTSGEITIITPLDREKQETYKLLVYVEDTNNTAKYQTGRQLFVKLLDINDNSATFTNPKGYPACKAIEQLIEIPIKENTGANVTVTTVKACDPDSPQYAQITYQLYNDNENCSIYNRISGLRLEPNGQIVTLRNIDYEQDKEFIMCVQAVSVTTLSSRKKRAFDPNQFMPYNDTVAYIHMTIEDLNDNGPKFLYPTANGIVQTDPVTGPVLTINAVDLDGPDNSITDYYIDSSVFYPQGDRPPVPFSGAFVLRGEQGAIYAARSSYQAYAGGRFVLKIVAVDRANSSLTDTQEVTIYVYQQGLAVKVILDLMPRVGYQYAETIIQQLDDVSNNYKFSFLRVSEHVSENSIDPSKTTDVCFLAVDSNTKNVLNIRQVVELLAKSSYQQVLKNETYHVLNEGQCYPSASSETRVKWRNLWWVLVAVAIFIFVCCVIVIILVIILYGRYKRYMETRKTYLVSQ